MPALPSGTVTFLFSDIEGSTSRWEHTPELMQRDFARQESLLRETFAARGGYVYKMIGDAFQVAFATAITALEAAIEAQRGLQNAAWEGEPIRVRMALHTGVTEERGDDYVGPVLNRVARLLATGHGGQVLLTQVTYELVRDNLPPGVRLADSGEHRLKDLIRPEHIYQITAAGLADSFPPLKTLDAYPHNLPLQLTSFVGREKEVGQVKAFFSGPAEPARLVTLTGPGGTGKTRLSLHAAADLLEKFPNGVWLVELAALTDPNLVLHTIASVLGVRDSGGQLTLAALVDYLRLKRLLLILDNCEHLVDACAHVVDALLRGCPQLCILASSRELLGVEGEISYRVPSLSLPDAHHLPTVQALSQFEAVRLFIERAASATPGFHVTNANAPALAEICHRLDGIPLAIELVAARVATLSVEQIATRLENSFRLLTGGSRTAMPRHQAIRALIDWSYDLLSPAEQALLQRVSVFQGGWTLEAAEEVCSDVPLETAAQVGALEAASGVDEGAGDVWIDPLDVLDLLSQLAKKSLVQVEQHGGEIRYRLLEIIRQYAHEHLTAEKPAQDRSRRETSPPEKQALTGAEWQARRRHLAYFLKLADHSEEELRGPDQAVWIERFEAEIDNIRAALEWSLVSSLESGLRLAAALLWFWHTRGYGKEGVSWLERLLAAETAERGQAALSPQRAIARARALNAAGFMKFAYEEGGAGQVMLQESLALVQGLGAEAGCEQAAAYLNLGRCAAGAGEFVQARVWFEQALAQYRAAGGQFGMAESISELSALEARLGHKTQAAALLQESLALRRSIGDVDGVGYLLTNLGEFAFLEGNFPRARQLLEESLGYFQQSHNRVFISMCLDFISFAAWMMGDLPGAHERYERFLASENDPGLASLNGDWLVRQGDIALAQGQLQKAAELYEQALAYGQQIGADTFCGQALLGLARLTWSRGETELAVRQFHEALEAAQRFISRGMSAMVYCGLARAAISQQEYSEASAYLHQALPLFQMPFFHWARVIGLEIAAALAACQQRFIQAAQLAGAVENLARQMSGYFSPAEREQYEAALEAAQAALGEEEFARLKLEGSRLPLEQAAELGMPG